MWLQDWQDYFHFHISLVFLRFGLDRTYVSFFLKALLHWAIYRATCLAAFKRRSIAVARTGMLHCQQLAKLRPRRTEERVIRILADWLIKQSILREVAGGVSHCAMLQKSIKSLLQTLRKVLSSSTLCNSSGNNNNNNNNNNNVRQVA